MNTRPKSKLELIIICLLFTLLFYLAFTNRSYERQAKIRDLNEIIDKQQEVIRSFQKTQNLNELTDELIDLRSQMEYYHMKHENNN